jgi:hypothetical protein
MNYRIFFLKIINYDVVIKKDETRFSAIAQFNFKDDISHIIPVVFASIH